MPTTLTGAVSMSASAGMDISETPLLLPFTPGSGAIPGAATYVTTFGTDTLAATAGLTAAGTYVGEPQAALAGGTTLAAAGQGTYRAQAPLAATSTLTPAAQATYFLYPGDATFAGATTLLEAVRSTLRISAALAADTSLTASAFTRQPVTTPTLTGVAALALGDPVAGRTTAALTATTSFTSAAKATAMAIDTLAATSTLTLAASMTAVSAAALAGNTQLTPGPIMIGRSTAALSGTSTLVVASVKTAVSTVALTGSGQLAPLAWTDQRIAVTLTGTSGGPISTLVTVWLGATTMSATAAMAPPFADRAKVAIVVMVAAAGLVADAGVHPIIPPGFVPRTVAALDTTPRWHLYIADTRTGRVAYELPVLTQQWTSKLNDIGTAQAEINIDDTYDAISVWDERDPRVLFRQFLTGPMRYTGLFAYGNQAVWAGPLGAVSASSSQSTVQLGFSEFAYMLTRRLLLGSRTDPTGVAGDRYYGPTSKQAIALSIVQDATVNAGGSYVLPWQLAHPLPTSGPQDAIRSYYGFDFMSAWDALSLLTQEADGPDVRFDPVLKYTPDGLYLAYDLQIGNPLVYNDTTWAWDVPSTASIAWDTNVQNFGTRYWGVGAGQDRLKLVAESANPTLVNLGFPELELSDTLHSEVSDTYQLQSLVDADMALYAQPTTKWTIMVQGSSDPLLGSFRVGDTFAVTVQNHPAVPDGTFRRRITALSGDQSDWATIDSADAYIVQSTTQSGVQLITNQ